MMEVCPPTACPPKPVNETRLLQVMVIAEKVGIELMPHQICMVASITELADGTKTGELRRKETLLLFARQSGKSATLMLLVLERLLTSRHARWLWGAQRLASAIDQVEQETWPVLQETGLAELVDVKFKKGVAPKLACGETGSTVALRSTGAEDVMRGMAYDFLILDELYSIDDFEAESSLYPTLLTRYTTGAAALLASTAPHERSVFLEHKISQHEKSANTATSRRAFWFWGADEDCNPVDREVWRKVIPGLAFGLIPEEAVEGQLDEMSLDMFKREMLTIRAPTSGAQTFCPVKVWGQIEAPKGSPVEVSHPVWLGIDAAPDQTVASVVAADASGVVELVERRNHVRWVAEIVEDLWGQGYAVGVGVLALGPLKHLIPRLLAFGEQHRIPNASNELVVPVNVMSQAVFAGASQDLLMGVLDHSIQAVYSAGVFGEAVRDSRRRPQGTLGGFTIARADDEKECSALVAAAVAYHAATSETWDFAAEDAKDAQQLNLLEAWAQGINDDW